LAPVGSEDAPPFIATLPASRFEVRLAFGVLLVSIAVFLALAPFARAPLRPLWAFIPIYESALTITDLITAVLLFGQFSILRSRAVLALAAGYLFTAFMAVIHALSFPGLFTPGGLFGSGPQTTAWLYMIWHGAFPLFVIAYILLRDKPLQGGIAPPLVASVLAVIIAAGGFAALATAGHALLPPIMKDDHYTPTMIFVISSVWLLSLAAAIGVGRRRSRSVLDLWLTVVMCAWLFDIALAAVLNAGRFDLGFYAGRIYGMLASSFVLVVLLLENGVLYARLVQAHDSERRKTLELTAANKELDSFSYSVSHDLRAPLRALSGYARILAEDPAQKLNAEGRRHLEVIRDACSRMSRLIEDLLEVSRLGRQALKTRRVDLDELVQGIVEQIRAEGAPSQVGLTIGELGAVTGDPTLLRQAFVNLIGNAVKFTSKTADGRVEVGRIGEPEGDARTYYVKDNGAGFDMKYASKLFGMFQRLHGAEYEGTGVGLAIVHRVIERHGGRIWAESSPGEGAAFYFTL
jgi:signal transduction histidine kinase